MLFINGRYMTAFRLNIRYMRYHTFSIGREKGRNNSRQITYILTGKKFKARYKIHIFDL